MSNSLKSTIVHSSLLILLLQVPLLFFASDGGFSFEHVASNSALGGESSELFVRSGSESFMHHLELVGVFGCSIVLALSQWPVIVELFRLNKLVCAIPLCAMASMVWSEDPSRTLIYASTLLMNTLFAFYIVARLEPDEQMQMIVVTGTIFSVVSVLLAILPPHYGISYQSGDGAWRGLAPHKNIYAIESVFLLSPVLVAGRKYMSFPLAAMYVIALTAQILLSQSRTGWLLLAACVTVIALGKILARFERIDAVVLASLGVCAVALAGWCLSAFAPLILESLGKSGTLTGRTDIWKAAVIAIAKRPLVGYGYSAFWSGMKGESANVILMLGTTATHAHNGFLNVWLDLGMVGLGLVVCVIVVSFRNALLAGSAERRDYVLWYVTLIVLMIVLSIDEQGLVAVNTQSWMLFLVASIGLSRAAMPHLLSSSTEMGVA